MRRYVRHLKNSKEKITEIFLICIEPENKGRDIFHIKKGKTRKIK